jgi:hypothetical protein
VSEIERSVFLFSAKKGILRDKKEFFAVLEQVERYLLEAADITTSVRDMPSIK